MIRRIIFFINLVIFLSISIYAQKTETDLRFIFEFKELSANEFYDENGEQVPWVFTPENLLYTVAADQREYRVYDSTFKLIRTVSTPHVLFPGGGTMWTSESIYYYKNGRPYILRMQGRDYPFGKRSSDPAYLGDFIFGDLFIAREAGSGKLYAFRMPPDPTGVIQNIPHELFIKNLREEEYLNLGLSERDGVLLYKDHILYPSDAERIWGHSVDWIGFDKDFNYLSYDKIHNAKGSLVQIITIPLVRENPDGSVVRQYSQPFFDYEGNYFIFGSFRDGPGKLYYIGRDWGFSNIREGKLNDGGVRVRLHPGTNELILGQVDKGAVVKVLEETPTKQTIGKSTAPWYKVKLPTGLVGWVFGAFVDIQKIAPN